jgi:hypothetical protein
MTTDLTDRSKELLANHPRLAAGLFTLLLLSQAGMVASEGAGGSGGP